MTLGGPWGQRAVAMGSGGSGGFGGGSSAPASSYSSASAYSRDYGNPAFYGPSDGNTQMRQFAQVGKANINLLDPLSAERANAYVPIDKPEGPLGGLAAYYSPSTPGGFFAGVLGAIGQTVGGIVSPDIAKGGSDIGTFVGKTLEAPLAAVGGVGLDSVPFLAPVIDGANSAIEQNSPYILRDTLKIPHNIGGGFQSMLNLLGLAGRAVERTYAGMADQRGALPEDVQARIDSGELSHDQALDELVMSGRGFSNDPMHNMVWSVLTDPFNWATLGVGAVAGAVKGTASIARVFSSAALREGSVVARLAEEGGQIGALAARAQAGEDLTLMNFSRGELSGMRRAVNEDLYQRVQNGEDIPDHLKLGLTQRMGMSALGPVSEDATNNIVYRVADKIAKATDPVNWFSGSRAGQRSMEQLHMALSTGVVAALKPNVVRDLTSIADNLVADGGDRIMDAVGTWGANAGQEVVAGDMASQAMQAGAIPRHGTLNATEASRQVMAGGGYDTNLGKYAENHIEKTKDIRVASLPTDLMREQTVNKLAAILGVDARQVDARVGKVSADMAMAVHGLYYYTKGKELHTGVMAAIHDAAARGVLPKDVDPHDLTMVTPRTLTNKRVVELDAAIKKGDAATVRAITENYDDFNWMNRQTVKDSEIVSVVRDYLDTARPHLPTELELIDPVTGQVRTNLPQELQDWARDGSNNEYGLANGMPSDAPIEAQWRVTHNADGGIRNAAPWLQFWADGVPAAKRVSRFESMRMSAFRGVRSERIWWSQRRRFITDMASPSNEAGYIQLPPELADRIFKALMYEAQQGRLLPRGMAPEQMMDAAKKVIDDARGSSGSWKNVGGKLTERQVVTGFLRAMEGDTSLVGVTQKITGRIKSSAPGAAPNYWGQLSEKLYPLMRFTLNPVFMTMEIAEPYILNFMRGVPLPLLRSSENFQRGLATHNAIRQFIFSSRAEDGLLAESSEMNALRIYQAVEAKDKFGATTLWGRIRGSRPAIAERKQAAAGLEARRLIGDNLYRAFEQIKGPDEFQRFWGGLEYEYGTVDRAEVAERWLASNLSLQDHDGHTIGLVSDLMNIKNIGSGRLRLTTSVTPKPGDYTFGDVEELLDKVRRERGLDLRGDRGLEPGKALMEDLQSMTEAEFMSELNRDGLTVKVGKISDSAANDIWRLANGPKADDFWKGHRDTYMRDLKSATGSAPETRRLRDQAIAATRAMVKGWAEGKNLTEEEYIALHFDDIPRWAVDAGLLPPQALTDIRAAMGHSILREDPAGAAYGIHTIKWFEQAHQLDVPVFADHPTQRVVNDIRRGSENRDFLYVPVGRQTVENLKYASQGYGGGSIASQYDRVGTDPIRAITRYKNGFLGSDHLIRVSKDEVLANREFPTKSMKRVGSHDYLLAEDITLHSHGMEIYTERGWVPLQQYIERGPVPAPTLREGFVEEPWWDHLFTADFGAPEPTAVFGLDFKTMLTPFERKATDDYTGIIYQPINAYWRGVEPPSGAMNLTDERILELSDALDASVKKGVLRERRTLYRGVSFYNTPSLRREYDLQVGDHLQDPAFFSMSDDIDTATDFAGSGVLMDLQLPAGFHMNLIEGGEGEHLGGRNIDWEVVRRSDDTTYHGDRIRLTLRPVGEASQSGTRRLIMSEPQVAERNVNIADHLAATDPDALRVLVARAPEDVRQGLMEVVEERIAKAEAAKPQVGVTTLGDGRRFGRITPAEGLSDIKAVLDEDEVADYATAWEDTRARVEYLMQTSDTADETGIRYDPPEVFNSNDTRALAGIAAALPERGGRGALNQFLQTLETLVTRGLTATGEMEQTGLLQSQHLLRGLKHPFDTPRVPPHIDDATDVMLGNTNRRHIGRTDLSQPIVADDAAYEGAGYLTQETLDDLTAQGIAPTAAPAAVEPIPTHAMVEVKSLGGSTGAMQVRDEATGKLYVEKQGASPGHIRSEYAADRAYEAAGVPVPHATMLDSGTKRAEMITGGTPLDEFWRTASPAEREVVQKQIQQNFALDALLANWDVVGLVGDNVIIKDGIAYRIDNGGALTYRAMGEPKGGAWGTHVSEIDRLRGGGNEWAKRIFGDLLDAEVRRQILDLSPKLDAIVAALPPELRDTVRARYDDMLNQTAGITPAPERAVAPTVAAPAVVTRTDLNHAYLVGHYNEMAQLANAEGLAGHQQWTAADMALLAGKAREARGRKPSLPIGEALDRQMTTIPAEVYFPPGSESAKWNPILDLLNKPENAAARHEFMRGVGVNFMQALRDDFGLIIDGLDDRGIGIWDGANPQPLVPVTLLGTTRRVRDAADIISYGMQQAEVWAYEVADFEDIARVGNWTDYHPRVTLTFDGVDAHGDAEAFATGLVQQFPGARGGTAIEMPGGEWQVSMIDTEHHLPTLADGQVDEAAMNDILGKMEVTRDTPVLANVDYGETYVAGPDKFDDGTYDWKGHHAATQRKLAERGAPVDGAKLDGLRSSHTAQVEYGLGEASPLNLSRVERGDPVTPTLEDRRNGQVFGTTTPTGASAAVIRGFGATDPLAGLHELIHVFSVAGADPSLRDAITKEWEQHATNVEVAATNWEAKAAAATRQSTKSYWLNKANAARAGIASPTPGAWGKAQEEFFVDLVYKWIDRGVAPNPEMANAFEHFRNWLALTQKSRTTAGMPPIEVSPQMQAKLSRMFSRPGVETVPYSIEQETMRSAARQVVQSSWEEAHATQYYKRDRSMVERSLNHPYIGLYPVSYMWGKILPEMVRFLALRPFGMETPFLAWNVAREVSDTIRQQSETDPSWKKFLADNKDAFMMLSMLFPALPQDIPANASLPLRRIAEQGLENEQAYAQGRKPKGIDYTKGAMDAVQYAVGPLGTIRTVSEIAGMGGTFVHSVLGGETNTQAAPVNNLLPVR